MQIAIYHELPSGGAKRAIYEVARRLARSHEVDVFTVSSADTDFCDLRPVVRRHVAAPFQPRRLFPSPFGRLNQWLRWRDLRRLDQLARQTASQIDRQGYQVVYAQASQYTQAPGVLNFLTTPSVYQAHEPFRLLYEAELPRPYLRAGWRAQVDQLDPLLRLYRRRLRQVDQRNTRRATQLLTSSQFSAANLKRIYGREAAVVYPGVDLAAFDLPERPERQNFLLSVGALRPNKGFDFIIAALAQIPCASRPPLRVVANADDGRERAYLVEQARRAQVQLTLETGATHARLVRLYQEAALVVYAPVNEPFGLVPLEAAAGCTPTVGVAEGGVRETILPDQTGLLTERSEAAFAAAVQTLLGDPARRDQLGRQAHDWVAANWSWDQTVASVEAALARAAAGD